ncbi:MAG TPA: hypothetical protein VHV49_05275 [Pseudonocardiaceae bacterium]|nr:hypothetical protein [Pseudonocardiaceae bacterium]
MGRVTLELSDGTLRRATEMAQRKGLPLNEFLAHQLDELVAANDRYERARDSVANLFPDLAQDDPANGAEQFFARWRNGPA